MKKKDIGLLENNLSFKRKIVLLPHKNPDGDALGSTLALLIYFKEKGHDVCLISPNSYSDNFCWLPYINHVIVFSEEKKIIVEEKITTAELIFLVDFNDLSRINPLGEWVKGSSALKVLIDHHSEPSSFDIMFSNPKAPSTTSIIYELIEKMGEKKQITKEIATCLYTGLVTDTGSFRFSISSSTHLLASFLVKKGAQVDYIHHHLYEMHTLSRFHLLSCVLGNLKFLDKFSTTYISLSAHEMKKYNYKKGDTEGFVNYGLSIKGIIFSVFFIEDMEQNMIKISFRSKGEFNVDAFAREHFKGGGHKNAAGGFSYLPLEETIKNFIYILKLYEKQLKFN